MNQTPNLFDDQFLDQLDWSNDPFGSSNVHSFDQSSDQQFSDQSSSTLSSIGEHETTFFHDPHSQSGVQNNPHSQSGVQNSLQSDQQWGQQSTQHAKYQPNQHQSNFHSNHSVNQFHYGQPVDQFDQQFDPSAFTQPADYAQFVDQSVDVSAFYQPVHQVNNHYHETVYANQLPVQLDHQSFNQSVQHQHRAHPVYHSDNTPVIPSISQPILQYVSAPHSHSIVSFESTHSSIHSSVNQQPITPHTPSYENTYHQAHHQGANQTTQHPINQPVNQGVAVAAIVSQSSNQLITRSTASSASQAIVVSNKQISKRSSKHQSIDLSTETSTDPSVDPKRMRHRALDRRRHQREQNILARLTTLINQANLPTSPVINLFLNHSLKQSIRALPARPDRLTLLDIACDHIENLHEAVKQTVDQSGSPALLPVMPHIKQWLVQLYSEFISQSVSQSIDPALNQLINPFSNQSINQAYFETCDWQAFTSETGHLVDVNSLTQPSPKLTDKQSITCLLVLEQLQQQYNKYLEFNQLNNQSNNPSSVFKAQFYLDLPYGFYGVNELYPPKCDPHFSTFMSRMWSLFTGEANIVHTRVQCTRDGKRGDNSAYMMLAPACRFWGKAPRANSLTKGRVIVVAAEPFKPPVEYESA